MRIVSGIFRGRRLAAPRGRAVRPTTDRVREALFDILQHGLTLSSGGKFPGEANVLDVFAGTGALGLEALSRGAAHVTFIEKDPAACHAIERNIQSLNATERVTLLRRNALRPAAPPAGILSATLFLMDPPYRSDMAAPALKALHARGWIARNAIGVVEMAVSETLDLPRGFVLTDERRYGDTILRFLKSEGAGEAAA